MPTFGGNRPRFDSKRIRAFERLLIQRGIAPHNAAAKAWRKARRKGWYVR